MAQDFETPFADSAAREIAATNHPDLRQVFLNAANPDVSPDQAASVLKLSAAADQPPEFVGANMKTSELAARARSLDSVWEEIDAKRPVSRNFLSLTSNMAIAHDDIHGIVKHESMIQGAAEWARVKAAHLELATLSQEYTASRYQELHGDETSRADKSTGNPIFDLAILRPTRIAASLLGVKDYNPDVLGSVPRTRQLQTRMDAIQKGLPAEARVSNDMVEAVPFLANMLAASAGGATMGSAVGLAAGSEGGPLALITGALGARYMQKAATADFFFKQGFVSTYDRLLKERDKSGTAIPEDRVRIAATINGGLQAGLSLVELDKLLPKGAVPPKLLKSLTKPEALKKFLGEFLGNSAHAAVAMAGFHAADIATDEYAKAYENANGVTADMKRPEFQHTTLTKALLDTLQAGVSGAITFSPLSALTPALGLRGALAEVNQSRKTREVLQDLMKGRDDSKVNKRLPALYEKFNGDALRDTPQETVHVNREAADRLFQKDGIDPAKQFEAMGLLPEYELAKATGEPIKIPTAKWLSESVPAQLPNQLLDDTKFSPEHKTVNEIRQIVEEETAKIDQQGKLMADNQKQAVEAIAADPELKAAHDQIAVDARARLEAQVPESLGVSERDKWLDANSKIVADHYVVEAARRKNVSAAQLFAAEFPQVVGADKGLTADGKDATLRGNDVTKESAGKEAYPQLGGVDSARAGDGEGAGRSGGETPLRPAAGAAAVLEPQHSQPLASAPPKGYEGPTPEVRKASEIYLRRSGLPVRQQGEYVKADPARGGRIADAFEALVHAPNDPVVKAAYDALIKETVSQLQVMREMGIKFEAIPTGAENPYKNSAAMIADARKGHLWYFPTKEGFGSGAEADKFRDHPLYAETLERDSNGQPMLANDVFRVVHDFFGHVKEGNGFGANGEENAWQSHVRMYSPEAGRAMTTETRGQNSWVNFHEKSAANRTAPGSIYADQKAGLLPEWVGSEGMAKDSSERLFQKDNAAPFYSKLQKDIEAKLQNISTVEQVEAIVREVKQDERDWSGIDGFLKGKTKIDKAELLNYLRANELKIEEVMKGEPDMGVIEAWWSDEGGANQSTPFSELSKEEQRGAIQQYRDEVEYHTEEGPKYSDYQLPGGENYRELLLTLPENGGEKTTYKIVNQDGETVGKSYASRASAEAARDEYEVDSDQEYFVEEAKAASLPPGYSIKRMHNGQFTLVGPDGSGDVLSGADEGQALLSAVSRLESSGVIRKGGDNFSSSHFDEPNILAHVRFNDRVDSSGKKVLLLEEVQSDWHQKGRRGGYRGEVDVAALSKERDGYIKEKHDVQDQRQKRRKEIFALDAEKNPDGSGEPVNVNASPDYSKLTDRYNELSDKIEAIDNAIRKSKDAVPDGPFKKTWHEFALKRMIRFAAENGYDKIAWTTGEQQAERYDLSKQVKAVHYEPIEKSNAGEKLKEPMWNVWATGNDGGHIQIGQHNAARLPDVVGKEIADKIISGVGEQEGRKSDLISSQRLRNGNWQVKNITTGEVYAEFLSKEEADKLTNKKVDETSVTEGAKTISGMDLKIGGEGMKGFYDKIVPSFLNKFGKKFGAQVGESKISERTNAGISGSEVMKSLGRPEDDWRTLSQEQRDKLMDEYRHAQTTVHSMPITPELKRAALDEGFALFQGEAANGEYVPDLNKIVLGKNANPTTLMHEFFHGALKHMFEFVGSGQATQDYLDHWEPMKKFLGIEDGQKKLTVDQQEKGARAWERYLRGEDQGSRPPSESLMDTFSLLRKWFTRVYKKTEGSPIAQEIPVDVRNFFDRLLASDDEIARAQAESGYNPGEIADLQDAPPEAARQLRTDQERARRQAEETLLREQMAELRDENKRTLDSKRAEFTASATADIKGQPIYQAMEEIRGLGDKTAFGYDLTPRKVAEQFLNGKLSEHSRGVMEVIAEVYGFADGTDLAKKAVEAIPAEDAIKGRVESSMAPYADLKNSEAIREVALKSIHANRMTELLYLEQKFLEEMQGDKALRAENNARSRFEAGLRAQAAREQARQILGAKPIKEATAFRVYVTAERNAAIRVTKALAAKDQAKAAQAKGEQAMNHALASESLRLRERVATNQRFLERFIQRGADLKEMPYGFTRQIDAMLSQFGMLPPKTGAEGTFLKIARDMVKKGEDSDSIANATGFRLDEKNRLVPETLNDLVDRISEDAQIVFIPESILRGADKLQSEMSPNDLMDLKTAVETISNVGRNFQRFISANLKGDVKEAAAMLRASIEKNVGTPYGSKLQVGSENNRAFLDKIERIKDLPDAAIPSLVNLLTVCDYLDGRDPAGPAKEYIYRPLKQAGDRKLVRYAQMNKDVNAIFEKHFTPSELAEYKNRREFFHFLGEKGRYLTHEEILMVALNWGNEGNRDRIRKGFGIDDYQVQAILDSVNETGWKFSQDIWDHLNTYWPEIVKLETLVNGVEPKGVEASPVNTRYGAFRGGYFPIAYDFTRSEDAYRTTEMKNALFKQYSSAAAHTDNGHTQTRVDSLKRPIRLNMDVLFNHLENVVHDLEFRPAVIDVSRFLRMMDAKGSITRALGVDGMRKVTMELKDAASDQGEFLSVGEKAFRWFRFNSTFATLAVRAFTLPMDITGNAIISGWEIGPGRTAQAIKDFAMNPGEMKAFVEKNSTRMAHRALLRDRDIMDLSRKWTGEESAWKQFAFIFQHISDEAVSVPLWNEVYHRSLDKYGHEKAVQVADEAVTRSFGSGARIDQVGVQKGSEFGKITSMYYSWLSMMFNRAWLEGKVAGLEYDKGNTGAALAIMAKTAFFAWGLQSANENLWRELFRNGQTEDPEGRKKRIISRTLQQPFSYIWIARDIAGYTIDKAVGQRADYRMTPLESSIQSIFSPIGHAANIAFSGNKEYDEKFGEEAARSAALLLGYPQKLNDMAFNFMDWVQGNGEATWRDLLTRRTKK